MKIHYHTSTRIWLHLEDFYNAGVTPQEAKDAIEGCVSGGLWAEPSGCNQNWTVDVGNMDGVSAYLIVGIIENALQSLVKAKGQGE